MQQINPQAIIDELSKRLQQAILENVVLSARITEMQSQKDEFTVIGADITEE